MQQGIIAFCGYPFLDGNGGVARLMSQTLLLDIGIGSALWRLRFPIDVVERWFPKLHPVR